MLRSRGLYALIKMTLPDPPLKLNGGVQRSGSIDTVIAPVFVIGARIDRLKNRSLSIADHVLVRIKGT